MYQLTCLKIYTNLLVFVFFHVFMSNTNSLKLAIKFPHLQSEWVFLDLFLQKLALTANKTTFTQIARNCKTFSNCIKLGLEVHAISKVAPKNCWIPLRSCKNALKCTKNAEQQQDWGEKYFS